MSYLLDKIQGKKLHPTCKERLPCNDASSYQIDWFLLQANMKYLIHLCNLTNSYIEIIKILGMICWYWIDADKHNRDPQKHYVESEIWEDKPLFKELDLHKQ